MAWKELWPGAAFPPSEYDRNRETLVGGDMATFEIIDEADAPKPTKKNRKPK